MKLFWQFRGTVILFAMTLICGAIVFAQNKSEAPPIYQPTQEQLKDLKIKQLEIQIAYDNYQTSLNSFAAQCETIKHTNKWPEDVTCSAQTLAFTAPPPKPKEPAK